MNKNNAWILVLVLIGIPFAYAMYLYPYLPEIIPTHFGANGKPDAFGGRNSIYLGPGILAGAGLLVYALLANLNKIDPKRYQKADDSLFWKFGLFIVAFMSCLSLVIIYATAHPGVGISKMLLPLMGIAFAAIGAFMPKFHQNYFAGLRLPWTLDNEDNWNATHKFGGKVWMIGGVVLALIGFVFDNALAAILFFSILTLMVALPIGFSYRMFNNGNKIS